MTVPVSTKVAVNPDDDNEIDTNHEMGFYIGKQHNESPPEPSNADVFISERKPMTVFTRYNLLDLFLRDKFENLMWI